MALIVAIISNHKSDKGRSDLRRGTSVVYSIIQHPGMTGHELLHSSLPAAPLPASAVLQGWP